MQILLFNNFICNFGHSIFTILQNLLSYYFIYKICHYIFLKFWVGLSIQFFFQSFNVDFPFFFLILFPLNKPIIFLIKYKICYFFPYLLSSPPLGVKFHFLTTPNTSSSPSTQTPSTKNLCYKKVFSGIKSWVLKSIFWNKNLCSKNYFSR